MQNRLYQGCYICSDSQYIKNLSRVCGAAMEYCTLREANVRLGTNIAMVFP